MGETIGSRLASSAIILRLMGKSVQIEMPSACDQLEMWHHLLLKLFEKINSSCSLHELGAKSYRLHFTMRRFLAANDCFLLASRDLIKISLVNRRLSWLTIDRLG